MIQSQIVDPSVSKTPIPATAADLPTVCVLCSHNCGIRVDVEDNRITAVRADESNPITHGYICNKGFSIPHYVEHAQRLEHPLRRCADGRFERITWDEAIREIAAKLNDIRARHTPRAIGLVGIGGQGNHMDGLYGLGVLGGIGSKRFFNAYAQEKTQHNLLDKWMLQASPAAFLHPDQGNTRFLVIMGTNPKVSHRGHRPTDSLRHFAADPSKTLVVIDPAFTETARLAHYVLPTAVGYEKWEFALFPRAFPEVYAQVRPPVVAGPSEALPEPEIYARLAEAMELYGEPPAVIRALAKGAQLPVLRAVFFLAGATIAKRRATNPTDDGTTRFLFWLYRTLGPSLRAPSLVAIYLLCHANALRRRADILRTLGPAWKWRSPFAIAAELFRRILAHPEGVEILRLSTADNLGDHIGFEDKKVHLAPAPLLEEILRAVRTRPQVDAHYPFVLATGLRTRWTANTIQRDPAWRKGRGPHCTLSLSPADAERLGVKGDDIVRVETPRNAVELPAFVDDRLQVGHVSIPNGFGMVQKQEGESIELDGVNINELTDVDDRDPFTGCPHHKFVPCKVQKVLSV